ncbi:MAG: alpha/beta hydrolase [Chloroflexi bacterium]|nr:alpha/beta hydrolase [Chloroflexota bacterium]
MTTENKQAKQENSKTLKEEKFVAVPGGKLAYTIEDQSAGKGGVVLCLPSLGDTRREYEFFAPALVEAGYRVITTDLRGMGDSVGQFKSFNLDALCDDITAILDAEKVDKATLVGCSVSGASIGLYAVRHPERVEKLVMLSPIMHTGNMLMGYLLTGVLSLPVIGRLFWATYFKSLYPSRPLEPDYFAELKGFLKRPGAMKSIIGMCLARRIDNDIQNIKVPTLIFFGTKDPDFKNARAEADLVQSKLPGANIKVLEGLGHYPHREKPESVLPETLAWLAA